MPKYTAKIARWTREYGTVEIEADSPEAAAEHIRAEAAAHDTYGEIWANCCEADEGGNVHGEAIIWMADENGEDVLGHVDLTTLTNVPSEEILTAADLETALEG